MITKIPRAGSYVKGNVNGREAEGMKEQKQASSSSRLMEDNKTIINIFRVWWWGRAKQDHMSSTQRGRMGVLGPPLLKSKWSNNTQSEMIHERKSPRLDRAEQPGKDCPSAWVVPLSHSTYSCGFHKLSPSCSDSPTVHDWHCKMQTRLWSCVGFVHQIVLEMDVHAKTLAEK